MGPVGPVGPVEPVEPVEPVSPVRLVESVGLVSRFAGRVFPRIKRVFSFEIIKS